MKKNKCIVLDRDGVLNELIYRGGTVYTSPWNMSEIRYKEGALEAVNVAKKAGFLTFIVSNQPGVHDHKLLVEELIRINNTIKAWFRIDDSRMALFPDDHDYYKPGYGMITELVQKYDIDANNSFMIGDRYKDIVAGFHAGVKTIFFGDYYWAPEHYHGIFPNYMAKDFTDIVKIICKIEF